jgi:hypothetical protein
MPERSLASPPGILAAALFLSLFLLAGTASAQVADAWLRYTPIDVFAGMRSSRLEAMGGIEVATEDDQSLINPYHYGRNPAGLLEARDSSLVRVPFSYQDFQDKYFDQSHSAVQRGAGIQGEFRPEGRRWGMAAEANEGGIEASRHDECPSPDDCRFIRDFDLPIAPHSQPIVGDRTFGAAVRAPNASLTYARTFFEKVTFGARLGTIHESEDRKVVEPYDLDVKSHATEIAGGALYPLPFLDRTVHLSAWSQYTGRTVEGLSESSLNEDKYTWKRPEVAYGGALSIKRGTWLQGIIDARAHSFDGEEVARVNWAPQFFLNPFPSQNLPNNVFKRTWSAFLSGLRHHEVSTRWLVGIPDQPVHFGLRYAYFKEWEWIRPNEVVLPTVLPLDVKRIGYRFAGGLSLDLPNHAGVIAAEAHIAREHRDDFTGQLPEISNITYTYHLGGEYVVLQNRLPVRAGVVLLRHDPNRQDGIAPFKGIGVTGGFGYYWHFIRSRIDAAYTHTHFHYSPDDPSEEIGYGNRVALTIQRPF